MTRVASQARAANDKKEHQMPRFLLEASFTKDGLNGLLRDGGTGRRDAVAKAVESVGGTLESFHFAFGEYDTYTIFDVPDSETAAAIALTVNAAGAVTARTVALLTPEQIDDAVKRSVDYQPPGS